MTPLWEPLVVGVATGAATLTGGSLVLRFRAALDLLLAFSSGTIVAVALFDLLPEALDLAGDSHSHLSITTAVAVGFVVYLIAERMSAITSREGKASRHFGPGSLTLHSLLDGLGIGLAFHLSPAAGGIVALGVLTHDCVDGANTVALSLAAGSGNRAAWLWLAADAIAPLAGILLASRIGMPSFALALLLGMFAGFFLYIGASQLLPRSQARRPRRSTIAATAVGMSLIYGVIWLAGR